MVDFAAAASAVGGLVLPPLEIVAGAMGAASIGFKVIDYSCKLLTGSDKDLGDEVIGEVSGIGVGKIIKSGELTGDLAEGTGDVLDLASSSNELIDSFFGQEKPTEPSKTNFLPQFRKFLADKTGIPFDFCDKPATTPTPAPTCSEQVFKAEVIPSVLNYGQTAEVKVTYCDPQNKLNNILVELDTRSGKQTKNIPISSPSGTVSFEIRSKSNSYGDCYDFDTASGGSPGILQSVVIEGIRDNANSFASFGALPDFRLGGGLVFPIPGGTIFDSSGVCDMELV